MATVSTRELESGRAHPLGCRPVQCHWGACEAGEALLLCLAGAAALDKRSRKLFEATMLTQLGAKAQKSPRIPAKIGLGKPTGLPFCQIH